MWLASFPRSLVKYGYGCYPPCSLKITPHARTPPCQSRRDAMPFCSPLLTHCSKALTMCLPEGTGTEWCQPVLECVLSDQARKGQPPGASCSRPCFKPVFLLQCCMCIAVSSHAIPVAGRWDRWVAPDGTAGSARVQVQVFWCRVYNRTLFIFLCSPKWILVTRSTFGFHQCFECWK